jgi:hypothetical protein
MIQCTDYFQAKTIHSCLREFVFPLLGIAWYIHTELLPVRDTEPQRADEEDLSDRRLIMTEAVKSMYPLGCIYLHIKGQPTNETPAAERHTCSHPQRFLPEVVAHKK